MGKRFTTILAAFVMFIVFASTVQAHSTMTSSDPEEGSVAEGEISSISMTFDTDIQQEEDIYVENEEGERIDAEEISIENDTVEASLSETLSSGNYTAYWEVYGADGHLVDGQFEFSVEAAAADDNAEENSEASEAGDDSGAAENEDSETNEEEVGSAGADDDNSGGMSGGVIALVVGLAVVAIAAIVFFARKRA